MKRATLFIGIERDHDNAPLDPAMRANALALLRSLAAKEFGGYTLTNAEGGWFNPDGVLVIEGAVRLDLYVEDMPWRLRDFAREAARLFHQHSVLLDFDGDAEFVEADGALVRVNAEVPDAEELPGQGNYAEERAAATAEDASR